MSNQPDPTQNAGPLLARFGDATRTWFGQTFGGTPTHAQALAWPAILDGHSTLLVAPTGSGKTLAAFLCAIDRLLRAPEPPRDARCQVLYVSPIKALAFDIEKNLRLPLAGIARTGASLGLPLRSLEIALRTGDSQAAERARFLRHAADILITTPESLYLLLTSQARRLLGGVDTVIIDEIHALAGTKRGTHLFLSIERLQALRRSERPLQRIGLSATQHPLQEVAQLLGGYQQRDGRWMPRDVVVADARTRRPIDLTIELSLEDTQETQEPAPRASASPGPILAPAEAHAVHETNRLRGRRGHAPAGARRRPSEPRTAGEGPAVLGPARSGWAAMDSRLVELIRSHRSTMVFVNNRRLAERLAAAINDCAGEGLARAHHGSLARETRVEIEAALKAGRLPCIVATSSLELGLDIGAIDLVIQIEAPPSVTAGIQRVGRANHQVGQTPRGRVFPKHRADLLACAEAARRMREGLIEPTRYPRRPLDVLAQHLVAIVAVEKQVPVSSLYHLIRGAAPYAELSRAQFDSVLDMLSGRYPADEFRELKPRLTWHREEGIVEARKGAQKLAVANAGVIPDRGLYGVFLMPESGHGKSRRVGELDEEMVFEARVGEVFTLGASSWRIEDIQPDRVLVSPAPGVVGKMPFWRGDGLGRSIELGRGIGALSRRLTREDDAPAKRLLEAELGLSQPAAERLLSYVRAQQHAPYVVPTDQTLVWERFLDEVGDHRACLLSPFGTRVHAPLALCMRKKARQSLALELDSVWTDDGIILRVPEGGPLPDMDALMPTADEVEPLLLAALEPTPIFASHFRECAGRALLLPRRLPGRRTPLWAQRRRAAQLLSVAARYPDFPIMLETYRECLQDVFDVAGLVHLLEGVGQGHLAVAVVNAERPSPFARALLFHYVGNFIYEADSPLAERRAAALAIDETLLRELLGQVALKDLLDPKAVDEVQRDLERRAVPLRHPDDVHDLLLLLGDLSEVELRGRLRDGFSTLLAPLAESKRVVRVCIAQEQRYIAAEDAARYRDAVGVALPGGLPAVFLEPAADPVRDLISRYARTHVPFSRDEVVARYPPLPPELVQAALDDLARQGRLLSGALHPQKSAVTFCDPDVMRAIKRKSLAALRKQTEPVEPEAYTRFLLERHSIGRAARGSGALLAALERLEGVPLDLNVLENEVLPARVRDFEPADLDQLLSAGTLLWCGVPTDKGGSNQIALYFRDSVHLLAQPPSSTPEHPLLDAIRAALRERGALFFHDLLARVGGFPNDVLEALWQLVRSGEVTNDTLQPLRSRLHGSRPSSPRRPRPGSRVQRGSEGRWSLLRVEPGNQTERHAYAVRKLLSRHGILVRDALRAEGLGLGYAAVYDVLRVMEETGKVRRGYFVKGLGAAQFCEPGADDLLRRPAPTGGEQAAYLLAATDPASPFGVTLPWPASAGAKPARVAGARLIVARDGTLLAWVGRRGESLLCFIDLASPRGPAWAACLAQSLRQQVRQGARRAWLLTQIDGESAAQSELAPYLVEVGFRVTSRGLVLTAGASQAKQGIVR